jgi:hypothetical protein
MHLQHFFGAIYCQQQQLRATWGLRSNPHYVQLGLVIAQNNG